MSNKHPESEFSQLFTSALLNYGVTALVMILFWIIVRFIFHLGINSADIEISKSWLKLIHLIIFICSLSVVYTTSYIKIEPLWKGEILFLGKTTGIWIKGKDGLRFIWFHQLGIFSIFASEMQHEEKKDIIVEPFPFSDKNGKEVIAAMNGDWQIGDEDNEEENYLMMAEADMPGNLKSLLRRTAIRVLGGKDYWKEMIGEELHDSILNDSTFKKECHRYGINFRSLILEVISGDIKQDNLNAYATKLHKDYKEQFPNLKDEQLSEKIEVQLKLAKKIIFKGGSQATPLVRIDGDS